jgi:hypothetical protein
MDSHLDINGRSVNVESKPHIRLLGVTIDLTLSFMTHAQNATSKGALLVIYMIEDIYLYCYVLL